MLRIYKTTVILFILLSYLSFGKCTDSDPDSESDVDYVDAMITGNKLENPVNDSEMITKTKNVIASTEKRLSYRSMELPTGASTTTSGDGFDPSKIFQHYDEQAEDLGCGFGNPHDMDAFSGKRAEHESHFGEFPWMVAISENDSFLGGGTLIAPDIVLTLASLFPQSDTVNTLQVVAGEWDVRSELEILPHLSRDVASILKHPQFNGYNNDIALLVLRLGFSRQPNIRPICLPTPASVIDHSLCISTSWSLANSKPKKFHFKIQPHNVCENRLASPYNTIYTSAICAFHVDDSTPTPNPISTLPILNSGAALFCPMKGNPNRYTQLGIVIGATDRNGIITGLFVNVSQFMPWIFKELGPRNTDLKYYLP